jgi:hypothetical protein
LLCRAQTARKAENPSPLKGRNRVIFISPSFHLVSHFKGIDGKYETSAHFRRTLPMEGHLKSMKREDESNEAFISPKTMLVSRRFMFRFTVPLAAANRP